MIEFKITDEMVRKAWAKSIDMGKLKNSITEGDGNIAGFIGEQVANLVIGGTIVNTKDYDLVGPDGTTYDVKTKRCTSEPMTHYECSVAAYNTVQKCDKYIFIRVEFVDNKYTRAWYLGSIDKNLYFNKARKLYKGQKDGSNWFTVKSDCYNLKIEDLNDNNNADNSEEGKV
jgi:hypothetical protein